MMLAANSEMVCVYLLFCPGLYLNDALIRKTEFPHRDVFACDVCARRLWFAPRAREYVWPPTSVLSRRVSYLGSPNTNSFRRRASGFRQCLRSKPYVRLKRARRGLRGVHQHQLKRRRRRLWWVMRATAYTLNVHIVVIVYFGKACSNDIVQIRAIYMVFSGGRANRLFDSTIRWRTSIWTYIVHLSMLFNSIGNSKPRRAYGPN